MEADYRSHVFSGDITKRLDYDAAFGRGGRVELDIGCGMGRFILARAAAHPEVRFLGIERLKPRVEKIARRASRRGLDNVFVIRLEATYVLKYLLPPHSVDRIYLFFPDPWPKRRHAAHRVFNDEFRSLVWGCLAPGGDIQVATDSDDYFADMARQMAADDRFEPVPPVARTEEERTNFELIFLGQGLQPHYAGFRARTADEIGGESLARHAAEDRARDEAFWNEEMPHGESVHVIGIGGVGMSAVAQGYLDRGAEVTGSDRLADTGDTTAVLEALKAQGVRIFPQDGSGIGEATTKVVASTAIEADNRDLVAARARGIETIHRSAAIEELAAGHRLIAVAGTSGKSTTTAMLGWILAYAGLDPVVLNGASVVGWDDGGRRVGSVRRGEGEWCVIEADESDRSFLRFHPECAIVTNESADHFDEAETHALFAAFKKQVSGTLVDGVPAGEMTIVRAGPWRTHFSCRGRDYSIPLLGEHNCMDAWQAAEMAIAVGVDYAVARRALLAFPGVERRLQRVGRTSEGALVIDDYGHNPAKLGAAMRTVAEVAPRMAVLWRPHGYGPLRHMLDALADCFAAELRAGDRLFLLPVYDAGGTADRTIHSETLAAAVAERGFTSVETVGSLEAAEAALRAFSAEAGGEGACLVAGARDPGLPRLARRLCASRG